MLAQIIQVKVSYAPGFFEVTIIRPRQQAATPSILEGESSLCASICRNYLLHNGLQALPLSGALWGK